jgi:preprotein translocase subunit SecE
MKKKGRRSREGEKIIWSEGACLLSSAVVVVAETVALLFFFFFLV